GRGAVSVSRLVDSVRPGWDGPVPQTSLVYSLNVRKRPGLLTAPSQVRRGGSMGRSRYQGGENGVHWLDGHLHLVVVGPCHMRGGRSSAYQSGGRTGRSRSPGCSPGGQ